MTYNVFSGTLNPTHFSSLLALAHLGGPGKMDVKMVVVWSDQHKDVLICGDLAVKIQTFNIQLCIKPIVPFRSLKLEETGSFCRTVTI